MFKKRRRFGFGFSDEISKVSSKFKLFKKEENDGWKDILIPNFDYQSTAVNLVSRWRITVLLGITIILFFTLFLRLFHLQVSEGKVNRSLAEGNRIQIRIIHAPRGVIFDKNGKVLAANAPAFRLVDEESKKVHLITREQALELEVKNDPRVKSLEIDNVRSYPFGEKLAHILGYVGEISEGELKGEEFLTYKGGDRIGKSGIEAQYEKVLRGRDGGEIVEVDSMGRKLNTLRVEPPRPGQNIYLTIDVDLQIKVFDFIKSALEKSGTCCAASIVANPKNGQILSLVSFPSYDPNIFTNPLDEVSIPNILNNKNSPILNRVISGTYPPGSTYKIVSSLAALDSSKIDENTLFEDKGVLYLGSFKFTNWYYNQYGRVEGLVDIKKALQRSNDTYFYQVARLLGEQSLINWSKKLKLGSKMEIDLPSEEKGLVPDDQWKRENFDQPWYPGDTLHMAIGQGFVLTTPIQIMGITSYIASDGILYKPQLVEKITSEDNTIFEYSPKVLVSDVISLDKIKIIQKGLELVTKSGGTAWPLFTFPISSAGKTGTAEFGDPKNHTHAWYTGYAPSDDAKIVMTVLMEGAGEGSSIAVPIVKEVFRWYFSEDKNKLIKDIYTNATESARTLGE